MMSVYQSVWEYFCKCEQSRDQLYLQRRDAKNEYHDIPHSIIDKLNQLPGRVTASLKIANLVQAYHLLDTYATSHLSMSHVSCDLLIPMFTSALSQSQLQHPFAELLFMKHFLPKDLLGKQSYILSTWEATCSYIIID